MIKIQRDLYKKLLNMCPIVPPEIGGVLAGKNSTITHIIFDKNNTVHNSAIYIPNIQFLNDKINEFAEWDEDFYGIFHSHIESEPTLSNDDKESITKIMLAMPSSVEKLYFPIIIPKKEMFVYVATRINNEIHIDSDELYIINDKEV
jgi:proteasome lid subunit RPN8/RPN11